MKYVGIEGSSYVGKTTATEELNSLGYPVIPEYDYFGPFPTSDGSAEGLMSIVDRFMERERLRTSMVGNHKLSEYVFSDRTPISLVTFEEMKILTAQSYKDRELHERVRDYAIDEINRQVKTGSVLLPDKIVILALNSEAAFNDRVLKRGVTEVEELALFNVQEHIAVKTSNYAKLMIGELQVSRIDTDSLNAQSVAQEIMTSLTRTQNPETRL